MSTASAQSTSGTSLVIASAIWSRWQDLLGRADLDGGPGHAPDDARRLVLGDGSPAQAAKREQSLGAVADHAGQERGDARPGPVAGHAAEEHVDRGAVADRPGLGRVMKPAVLAQDEVIVGAGEQDLAARSGRCPSVISVTGRRACSESHWPRPGANAASTCWTMMIAASQSRREAGRGPRPGRAGRRSTRPGRPGARAHGSTRGANDAGRRSK